MKFGDDVLLEIVDIVRNGIVNGTDISQLLREIDVEIASTHDCVVLTQAYLEKVRG